MFQELKCKVCSRIGKKGLVFLRGAAMLTVCSLLMRTVGVGFNVYITGVLGAGGVGLFFADYLRIRLLFHLCALRRKPCSIKALRGGHRTRMRR